MQKHSLALYFILISHSFPRVISPPLQEAFLSSWACICISSNTWWRTEEPEHQRDAMKRFSKWCAWDWMLSNTQSAKDSARRARKILRTVHVGLVWDWEAAATGGTWELSHFTALPLIFGSQVDFNHFESGTVLNIVFVLCIELLSTPLIQIIIQQKLVYTWQGCKSDPFKIQGKPEIMSYRNLSKKTINWGGQRIGKNSLGWWHSL